MGGGAAIQALRPLLRSPLFWACVAAWVLTRALIVAERDSSDCRYADDACMARRIARLKRAAPSG